MRGRDERTATGSRPGLSCVKVGEKSERERRVDLDGMIRCLAPSTREQVQGLASIPGWPGPWKRQRGHGMVERVGRR